MLVLFFDTDTASVSMFLARVIVHRKIDFFPQDYNKQFSFHTEMHTMPTKHRNLSIHILFSFLLLSIGITNNVMASCRPLGATNGLSYYTVTASGINPPAFNPQAYSIGATIYRTSPTFTHTNASWQGANIICTENSNEYWIGSGTPINKIYPTSINGLGIRITRVTGSFVLPFGFTGYYTANYSYTVLPIISSSPVIVELIKTGEITAGGSISGVFAEAHENTPDGQLLIQVTYANPVIIKPTIPTCSVSTPSVTVPLASVEGSSFKGVGSTSAAQPFQLGLACSGGNAGTSTNTYITFTDANQLGNTSTTLTLASGAGAAGGLGLQILNGGTPIGYGPDSSATGNTNQWKVATIAQGVSTIAIPLSVRYIQTGNSVTPGSVTGRATFTMSYQ